MQKYIFIAVLLGGLLVVSTPIIFAAPFTHETNPQLIIETLRGGAKTIGLVGGLLATQHNPNMHIAGEFSGIMGRLNQSIIFEMQKVADVFGGYVDDLPQKNAELAKHALQQMMNGAITGKTVAELTSAAATTFSNIENDIILMFNARDVVQKLNTSAILASPYGTFIGKTADGASLGVFVVPGMTDVLLTSGSQIIYQAPISNGIATISLQKLGQLLDDGDEINIDIAYRLNSAIPAFVLPVDGSPLAGGNYTSIDALIKAFQEPGTGVATLVNVLAANGRSCAALDAPVASTGGIENQGLLAQVGTILRSLIEKIISIFKTLFAYAAGDATICAAVDQHGHEIAKIITMNRGNASGNAVMRINGVDVETRVQGDVVTGRLDGISGSAEVNHIALVDYLAYKVTLSGTDFGDGPTVKINGEVLAAQFIVQDKNNLTLEIPPSMRKVNPNIVSIIHSVSKKESKTELFLPQGNKPIPQQTKDRVLSVAAKSGIALQPQLPQDQGELIQYLLGLWRTAMNQQQ